MANRPIELSFIADVAQYLREVKKMEVTTEDVADALVATSNSADDLERKLSRAMRDAEKDVETLERAVDELPKATDDAAGKMQADFADVGDSAHKSMGGETGKEIGAEFMQNIGEGIGSGQINVQDAINGTLGAVVGAAGAVGGPVLAGVGLLAAAVWGHFRAESEKHKEQLAAVFDMTDEITGQINKLEQFKAAATELGGGDYVQGIKDLQNYADTLGVSVGDLSNLIGGELNPATKQTEDNIRATQEQALQLYLNGKITREELARIDEATGEVLGTTKVERDLLAENADLTATKRKAVEGVAGEYVELNKVLSDTNEDTKDVLTNTEKIQLKAADTNMDGMVSSIEAANAGLTDAYNKALEIDNYKFTPKVIDVGMSVNMTAQQESLLRNSSDVMVYERNRRG